MFRSLGRLRGWMVLMGLALLLCGLALALLLRVLARRRRLWRLAGLRALFPPPLGLRRALRGMVRLAL